jgi:phage shock protein A
VEAVSMNLFNRLSDLLGIPLPPQEENPAQHLARILREMEDCLAAARTSAALAIAAAQRLAHEVERQRGHARRWAGRTRQALAAGHDDRARAALFRKSAHETAADDLAAQRAAVCLTVESVRASLRALAARLVEARCKQCALLARHETTLSRLELCGSAEPRHRFDQLEAELRRLEEDWAAHVVLDDIISGVSEPFVPEHAVAAELAALKRDLNKEK